jgi:diacylglycerol kinase (CTP)
MAGADTKDIYPILTVFLCIVGSAELLRFNFEWFNRLYCFLLGPLMRPSEVKNRINGVVYYLLGKILNLI